MKKLTVVLLLIGIIAGFTVGFVCGKSHSNKVNEENVSRLIIFESCGDITDAVNCLTLIRKERVSELADEKEYMLSSEVFALSQTLSDDLLFSGKPAQVLRVAANYRNTHPFLTGQTDMDEQVKSVLRRAIGVSDANTISSEVYRTNR